MVVNPFVQGFLSELEKCAKSKDKPSTPEFRAFLDKVDREAKAKGLNIFAVVERDGMGHSITRIKGAKGGIGGAVSHARKSHIEWEKPRGIDSGHDWNKDAGLKQKLMAGVAAAGMCVGGGCAKPVEQAVIRAAKPVSAIEHSQGLVDSIADRTLRDKMQRLVDIRKAEEVNKNMDAVFGSKK